MHDLYDYLSTRRTIPSANLGPPGPDQTAVRDLITLASRTPDHGKLVPWRFVVIEGPARLKIGEQLLDIALSSGEPLDADQRTKELHRLSKAPVVVMVVSTAAPHPKIPEWEQQMAAGAVCMNMIHGARALGFSAQWLTEWYSYDAGAAALLGVTSEERIAGFIHIGTPTIDPVERARPDVDQLISYWTELEHI